MNEQGWGEGVSEPVFSGLRETGVTGRQIACALKISPATVSKWRRGRAPIPAEIQVFLTLMLASQVDRLGDLYGACRIRGSSRETFRARDAQSDSSRFCDLRWRTLVQGVVECGSNRHGFANKTSADYPSYSHGSGSIGKGKS